MLALEVSNIDRQKTRNPASWRQQHNEFIDDLVDAVGEDSTMSSLEDLSKAVFDSKSEILGNLVQGLIQTKYAHILNQEYCACTKCTKRLKSYGKRSRIIETMAGKFELNRPYFYCKDCSFGFFPIDDMLCLSDSPKQYDIQRIEAHLSSGMPYAEACDTYERITGDDLSAHHIYDVTNAIGECIDLLDICPTEKEVKEKIEQLSQEKAWRPVMMLGIDGAHGPMRPEPGPHPRQGKRGKGEWKEIKGFRLYLVDSRSIIHLASWHQVCNDQALAESLRTIKEAGLIPQDKIRLGIIGDGAPWIWNRSKEIFPEAKFILDYYHCSEHIHEVSNELYGKGTREAREWTEATLTRICFNQMSDVLTGLDEIETENKETEEKIVKLSNYLSEHRNKTGYSSAKRVGYNIGSGSIESSNKFISNTRLKRSGAWWNIKNANNILKIRCSKYNGTYDRAVDKYKEVDQIRVKNKFPKGKIHLVT